MRIWALLLVVLIFAGACTAASPATVAPVAAPVDTPADAPSPTAPAADAPGLPTPTSAAEPPAEAPLAVADLVAIDLRFEPVAEGLDLPVFVTHAGDGSNRLFILEKVGRIRIWQDGQLLATPFLDISDLVSLGNEQGLLGLAFAPDYASSGYIFVNYTDLAGDTVVARYRVAVGDSNLADPTSATTILTLDQPAVNHNGGMLAFGPDGMLWIGTGDGGASNDRFGNGQNPATLLGKMLRIDVTSTPEGPYAIPADNPWVDAGWNGSDVADEVWAVGLRNPWRYSFDRATDDLWIADVGQNRIEEVNLVPAGSVGGLNFGWPLLEGSECFQSAGCDASATLLPVTEYTHAGHCSVTGGYVYRGIQQPAWNGVYFYGDYCSGVIWGLAPDGAGGWNNVQIAESGFTLSSFGEDEVGEIYVTDLGSGTVFRLTR